MASASGGSGSARGGANAAAVRANTTSLRGLAKELGSFIGVQGLLTATIGTLITSLNKANSFNTSLISINKSLDATVSQYSKSFENLPGGFHNLETVIHSNIAGLRTLDKSTVALFSEMRAVGIYSSQSAAQMAAVSLNTGLNTAELGSLSKVISKGTDNQVTTADRIVAAMADLSRSIQKVEVLGLSKGLPEAIAELTSRFPASSHQLMTQTFNKLLANDKSVYMQMSKMGMLTEYSNFLNSKSSEEFAKNLELLIRQGASHGELQKTLIGNNKAMGWAITDAFGPLGNDMMTLNRAMQKTIPEEKRDRRRFMTTWTAFKEAFTSRLLGQMTTLATGISKLAGVTDNVLGSKLGDILAAASSIIGTLVAFKVIFKWLPALLRGVHPIGWIAAGVSAIVGMLGGWKKTWNFIADAIGNLHLQLASSFGWTFLEGFSNLLQDSKFNVREMKVENMETPPVVELPGYSEQRRALVSLLNTLQVGGDTSPILSKYEKESLKVQKESLYYMRRFNNGKYSPIYGGSF